MSQEVIKISLKDVLRQGTFGSIKLGMSREEIETILGKPDGVMQRKKDKYPTGFVYGDIEFYFVSSSDNRLCTVYFDHFDIPKGNKKFLIDPWVIKGRTTRAEIENALAKANIPFHLAECFNPTMIELETKTGIKLAFCEEENDPSDWKGLYCVSLDARETMEIYEPTKQIAITVPLDVYEKIRREAVKSRRGISKICRDWIINQSEKLQD